MKRMFCLIMVMLIEVIGCTNYPLPQQQINYKVYVKNRLKLSDEQENSYRLIMELYESKKQAIIEKYRDSRDVTTCQNELTALSNETLKSLEILLTEKQFNEWRNFIVEPTPRMNEPSQEMGERKTPPDGGPPPGGGRRGW